MCGMGVSSMLPRGSGKLGTPQMRDMSVVCCDSKKAAECMQRAGGKATAGAATQMAAGSAHPNNQPSLKKGKQNLGSKTLPSNTGTAQGLGTTPGPIRRTGKQAEQVPSIRVPQQGLICLWHRCQYKTPTGPRCQVPYTLTLSKSKGTKTQRRAFGLKPEQTRSSQSPVGGRWSDSSHWARGGHARAWGREGPAACPQDAARVGATHGAGEEGSLGRPGQKSSLEGRP